MDIAWGSAAAPPPSNSVSFSSLMGLSNAPRPSTSMDMALPALASRLCSIYHRLNPSQAAASARAARDRPPRTEPLPNTPRPPPQ